MIDKDYFDARWKLVGSGCWEWQLKPNNWGYGMYGRLNIPAHRASYILHKGEISKRLEVDHLCLNKICVNPDHLEAVTRKENAIRAANNIVKPKYCKRGHSWNESNTRLFRGKYRQCRECESFLTYLREGKEPKPRKPALKWRTQA